ncbi:helix-turn-helix transcriptional regulator [Clostridium beijerinckii]|uniref:helix-turn-helix transcriptional regulator n=1 Tax=Clostridium beijerinckii TaxID=1520 RepID=UPI003B00C6B7
MINLKNKNQIDTIYRKGYGNLAEQLSFKKTTQNEEQIYEVPIKNGTGYIYQINPAPGVFISMCDWVAYKKIEYHYQVNQTFTEIYLLESGNISLVMNGKKTYSIPSGVNVYINNISQGRICYKPNIPIKCICILLFDDFIRSNIGNKFIDNYINFEKTFSSKSINYNTPEITLLFLQIKQKLLCREKSRLYYESKIGELLSIIRSNFNKEEERLKSIHSKFPLNELKRLELVKLALDQNIANPPEIDQLCKIAAMGKTKLRESFKLFFNITIGGYVRQVKMKHSLMLMSNNQLSIQKIATSLGYSSTSKFSISFKKIYGQSPSEYRKNILLTS